MVTFTHYSFAKNSRDITNKQIHSKKYTGTNRQVVDVFKVAVFCIGGRDFFKRYAVFRLGIPEKWGKFTKVNEYLARAVNCRIISTWKGQHLTTEVLAPASDAYSPVRAQMLKAE